MTITQANTATNLITAGELERLSAKGFRGELIRGELCETMASSGEHGETVANLVYFLQSFVKPHRLGRIAASDSGVWLERDPDTVREPDIAFFSNSTIPAGQRVPGYYEVAPDIVVEVVSPSNSTREINDRARMWISYGARIVWVIFPETRTVVVHRKDEVEITLNETDALDGGDVLPGFTCNIAEIFN